MVVRLPGITAPSGASETALNAVDTEIIGEMASSLGNAGRKVESCMRKLRLHVGDDESRGPLVKAAADAVDNDVHVVGVSSQAAGHKTLVPQLIAELKAKGAEDISVVVGGVIPPQDYEFLRQAGVAAIFGPGTNIVDAAGEVLDLLER